MKFYKQESQNVYQMLKKIAIFIRREILTITKAYPQKNIPGNRETALVTIHGITWHREQNTGWTIDGEHFQHVRYSK